ncbi:MAG: urea transport system permease protein [Solirubrobacteraceae bacterium]|jgi:urea transport system permease protein|nr:urea transport system permease protein [Solirubrobacteraceae bacterium]MEA2317558.1 urea transport system permease protein [Solirubrobacteraceae bacterium]
MDSVVNTGVGLLADVSTLILASLGLAVVFGLMRVINFAHGAFIMAGAFTTVTLVRHGMSFWIAIPAAALVGVILGIVVERTLIRPLYGRRTLDTLLATFGLSLVMYQLAVNIFGTAPPGISAPLGKITVGRFGIPHYTLVLIVATVLIVAATWLLFTRTRYGVLARAAIQSPDMAAALGVDSKRMNLLTFMLGCGLAGLAGGIIAPTVSVDPTLGDSYLASTFLSVVVAGPAFLTGLLGSGVMLGGVDSSVARLATAFWGQAALLVVAIVALRVRTGGISASWRRDL